MQITMNVKRPGTTRGDIAPRIAARPTSYATNLSLTGTHWGCDTFQLRACARCGWTRRRLKSCTVSRP